MVAPALACQTVSTLLTSRRAAEGRKALLRRLWSLTDFEHLAHRPTWRRGRDVLDRWRQPDANEDLGCDALLL